MLIADINGDGTSDIVARHCGGCGGGGSTTLYFLDSDFAEIYPPVTMAPVSAGVSSTPVTIHDLDGDGDLEALLVVNFELHIWDLPNPGPLPATVEWGSFRKDNTRSAFYHSGALPPKKFVRGDVDISGTVDVSDVVAAVRFLFLGANFPCLAAVDFNDDGAHDLVDAIRLVTFLFVDGSAPEAPFPDCGSVSSPPSFPCQSFECP